MKFVMFLDKKIKDALDKIIYLKIDNKIVYKEEKARGLDLLILKKAILN